MNYFKYKLLLSACLSTALALGPGLSAYGETVITPLEESSVAHLGEEGNGPSVQNGSVSTQGPGTAGSSQNQPGTPDAVQDQESPDAVQTEDQVQKPVIAAEGAVLLEASTGKVLYGKNAETRYYPASITKLMTALLVAENCGLDDTVNFSATATTNLEAGAVSLNLTEGDQLTVRQCLYALLLKSANEVGNALAEHTAGSNAKFADMMNARAAELGCTNTNFSNPHGLNGTDHYTTPHDMALITRAALENATVRTVASSTSYDLPATKKNGAKTITMGHKMLYSGDSRYYPGIIGGKTGYTSKAGNTLATAAEVDGVRLIAVVMMSKSTHYTDTKALLDYGFQLVKQQSADENNPSDGGPGTAVAGWNQDQNGWYYIQSDGTRAAGRWLTLDGQDYWFDADAYMANGWRRFDNGAWYYFRSSGAMARNYWVESGGSWFYLGGDGVMMTNTTTPDGCRVDGNGVWVE